jgi:hypothetical protein
VLHILCQTQVRRPVGRVLIRHLGTTTFTHVTNRARAAAPDLSQQGAASGGCGTAARRHGGAPVRWERAREASAGEQG